jgi:hypothetical protein
MLNLTVELSRFARLPDVKVAKDLEDAFNTLDNNAGQYDMAFIVIRRGDYVYRIDGHRPEFRPLPKLI